MKHFNRRALGLLQVAVAVLLASVLTGCEQAQSVAASDASATFQQCPPVPDYAPSERSPHCYLEKGTAEAQCLNNDKEEFKLITRLAVEKILGYCGAKSPIRLRYDGEIDKSLITLLKNISSDLAVKDTNNYIDCLREKQDERACEGRERQEVSLLINSKGGDVEAAIQIAEEMSNRPWVVAVDKNDACHSACVFLLTAARVRIVLGEVGIHRLYPSNSKAATTDELARDLEGIVERAKALLRRNGVSPSLADDMMSIPSSKIRVLSREERDSYGLGHDNAAQVDLERLALERRCGRAFTERLFEAEERSRQCSEMLPAPRHEFAEYAACANAAYRQLGFPDKICPNDGPTFMCGPDAMEPTKIGCKSAQ